MKNEKKKYKAIFLILSAVMIVSVVMVGFLVKKIKEEKLLKLAEASDEVFYEYSTYILKNRSEKKEFDLYECISVCENSLRDPKYNDIKDMELHIINPYIPAYIYSSAKEDSKTVPANSSVDSDEIKAFCDNFTHFLSSYPYTSKLNYSENGINYLSLYYYQAENKTLVLVSLPEKSLYTIYYFEILFFIFFVLAFAGQIALLIIVIKKRSEKTKEQDPIVSDSINEEVRSDKADKPHKTPDLPIKAGAVPDGELKLKADSLCVFCRKQKGTYDLMGKQVCSDCRDKLMIKLSDMK